MYKHFKSLFRISLVRLNALLSENNLQRNNDQIRRLFLKNVISGAFENINFLLIHVFRCKLVGDSEIIFFSEKVFLYSQSLIKVRSGQGIAYFWLTNIDSLNYFVLKTLQGWVRTSPPNVLSSVKKSKPLFRGPVILKKCDTFIWE